MSDTLSNKEPVKIKTTILEKVVKKTIKNLGCEINSVNVKQIDFSTPSKYSFLKTNSPLSYIPKIIVLSNSNLNKKITYSVKEVIFYVIQSILFSRKKRIDFTDYCFIVYLDYNTQDN